MTRIPNSFQSSPIHAPHSLTLKSDEGKNRPAANGRRHVTNPDSIRQLRASLADVDGMVAAMAVLRRSLGG